MEEKIDVICPFCQNKLKARISLIGQKATCPNCKNVIDVVVPSEPPTSIEKLPLQTPEEPLPQVNPPRTFRKPVMRNQHSRYTKPAMPRTTSQGRRFSPRPVGRIFDTSVTESSTNNASSTEIISVVVLLDWEAILQICVKREVQSYGIVE